MLEVDVNRYEVIVNAVDLAVTDRAIKPENLTLHTKLIVIDERYMFVGSLNLDPRSIEINAEMGLLIDSPEMAKQLMAEVTRGLEQLTYKLELDDGGSLQWHATIAGDDVIETREPLTSGWRQLQSRIYRVLPEGQL